MKIVFLLHKFHLALAQVYKRLIEGVSFWVYQELTEKTEFLFNFISVLSVVSFSFPAHIFLLHLDRQSTGAELELGALGSRTNVNDHPVLIP